ncbi:hypothetical protein KVG96_02850 [Pseudomonas sp. COR58]|uniref:Dermonecrotic toxin N-terminal domain-containing protein n=1 Tax=Pseudomonas ekonensis TaxID=2842353 RepID=A0ABS6P8T4_9PSED|nr:DUF6543 domain-containing protein [Pseudomonas ekonensis]MBV4456884.1 hypothetical protein [Pseudomonas ekonensis]
MFDLPVPALTGFGPFHPLPPNVDQRLYLQAMARCNDCRRQWLALMAQCPPAPASGWWSDRALGTPLSRRDHALSLYRQHFEAVCDLARAEGLIDTAQWQQLLNLAGPTAAQDNAASITQPLLKSREGQHQRLLGVMMITFPEPDAAGLLLYSPAHSPALRRFADEQALERWLIERYAKPAATTGLERIELGHDPLRLSLLPLLAGPSPVAGHPNLTTLEALFAETPTQEATPDDTDASPFGLMTPDTPLHRCRQALIREQAALDTLLGDDPHGGQYGERLTALKRLSDALANAAHDSHQAAAALLDAPQPLDIPQWRQPSNAHYQALHRARLEGLRAEAQWQRLLGHLDDDDVRRLSSVLDAPPEDRPPDATVARITLTAPQDGIRHESELEGVLVIAAPSALEAGSREPLLLHWPGRDGGLQRFDSREAMAQDLFKQSAGDPDAMLHLTPLSRDPFTWALQGQLYGCEQRALKILRDCPLPSHARHRAQALARLREQSLPMLTVAIPAARELAFSQRLEQDRSAALAEQLPPWLGNLSREQRVRFRELIHRWLDAAHRSQALVEGELPPRDAFFQTRIDARLRKDFALRQPVAVTLDLPVATTYQKSLMAAPGPGTPQELVLVAGQERMRLTLVELARLNIDDAMQQRLAFLKVIIDAEDDQDRRALERGITAVYLRTLVADLDLPGHYERQLLATFLGPCEEPAFSNAWRRECLGEPWRLMLRLQGELALLQGRIDRVGRQVFEIATDASEPAAYAVDGKRIELLPVHLSVGGKDTPNEGPSTLAGVTFIVERSSGLTLQYLPDAPDGDGLRQFGSLEEARRNLFNRCRLDTMVGYLAGRAVTGDPARHAGRINEAQRRNFDRLIGIGPRWPATTSLAGHLIDVHMGRLLEAHRSSARSNDALAMERHALACGSVFNYLKMALGLVPFVGTAIALYDAWGSANRAAAAFLRGDALDGLNEVESVLLSLIDAAMDLLPAASAAPAAARSATRLRHLAPRGHAPLAPRPFPRGKVRGLRDPFKGYEYEHEISLAGLHPPGHGAYRNVYRHADGDFILRAGRPYRVVLSDGARGWRLAGTSARGYKMPVALDENGRWDTHYAVHGTLMDGGGLGGGAALGHLADGLDPLWPQAIRQWLPRWWTDRHLRRQLTLTRTADAITRQLESQTRSTNVQLHRFYDGTPQQRKTLRPALENACLNDIETARNSHQTLTDLQPLSHGRKRAHIEDTRSRNAWVVVDRTVHRIQFAKDRLVEHLDSIDALLRQSEATPPSDTRRHLALMDQRKSVRMAFLKEYEQAHALTDELNQWQARITRHEHRAQTAADVATVNATFSRANHDYLKTAHLLEMITRADAVDDTTWMYFHVQLKRARTEVGRTLYVQHNLPQVQASQAQRRQILEEALTAYGAFRRNLNAWRLGYPQHLDLAHLSAFLDELANIEHSTRNALRNVTPVTPAERAPGKKLFRAEDDRLLIGSELTDPATRSTRFTIEGVDGRNETWVAQANGKYRLHEAPAPAQPTHEPPLQPLLNEARKRLDAQASHQERVHGYARQDMLPVDLEDMMLHEAQELTTRAQIIERRSPHEPLVRQLTDQARQLTLDARSLRIRQSMGSKTPTEGYLDYLLEQNVADLVKEGGLRDLGKRPDGTRDFLQEYAVRDLIRQPAQTLWYVHIHFPSNKASLTHFSKAHLKLPEQRNLGLQWQQAQAKGGGKVEPIWRGDLGRQAVLKHFAAL